MQVMSRLRKPLVILATSLGVVVFAFALLWLNNTDSSIDNLLGQHVSNILTGKTNLAGNRTPGELIRYAKRRLEGHSKLEMVALPPLFWLQSKYERPVPTEPLPTLGKGQQPKTLPPVPGQTESTVITVQSAEDLLRIVPTAKSGQTILLSPGTYRIGRTMKTVFGGTSDQPITLRAAEPGTATIELVTGVGFKVAHPFWIFENLTIRGACEPARYCEHAFHIFGPAQGIVIRNNHIQDFNSHIKINGYKGQWPDSGVIQSNTMTNTIPRDGKSPVTPIDLVGADNWKVLDNVISNFVKYGGNQIAYGVFMKGDSHYGRIERNLIICATKDISQPGVRVGLSFGGGTTGKQFCRDQACVVEHTLGLAANNIIAHCNDAGIDVNRSTDITLAHNTLINTAGLDVRGKLGAAKAYGNHFEGLIRQRDGATLQQSMNESGPMATYFESPDKLDLHWRTAPDNIPSVPFVGTDFCNKKRLDGTPPGALISKQNCDESTRD